MKKEIIAFFKKNPQACIKSKQLAKKLGVFDEHEYHSLKAQLHQLVQEQALDRKGKKYCVFAGQTKKALTGELEVTRQGFGFVVPDDKKHPDIFVAERNLNTAMNGDKVEVSLFADQRRKAKSLEGEIVRVLKRKYEVVTGTLRKQKSFYFVTPDAPDFPRDIYISSEDAAKYKDGSKVLVGEIEWEDSAKNPDGRILQLLMREGSFVDDYMGIIAELKLRYKFPDEVIAEAENIPVEIPESEIKKRVDFRDQVVMTIDPEDAKDFDDALSVEILKTGNYKVGIHIADVSHYVTPDSALDREARLRGNSVYLPGKVLPMLPERLSNGICSLVPNADRLTFSAIVELTPRGKVENYEFRKTIINSKRRFTYEQVQEILMHPELFQADKPIAEAEVKKAVKRSKKKTAGAADAAEQVNADASSQVINCVEELLLLNKLAGILRKKRFREGSINFETPEIGFIFGDGTVPVDIKRRVSDESHYLVEEFMLLANKLLALLIKDKGGADPAPFVYRVHDLPDERKQQDFINLLKSLGYKNLPVKAPIVAKEINKIIDAVHGKPEEVLINELAVRSMAKAEYSTVNIGHYGLGFKHYTHFTSPIRRYSDLLAHRILFAVTGKAKKNLYRNTELQGICEHISFTERTATEAERNASKLKKIQFLRGFIGEEFDAVVSGVTNYGLFVEIINYLAEGLIRLRDMDTDYFIYDERKYSLIGRKTGKVYRLGDSIKVRLIRVDDIKLSLDFQLLTD